MISIIICSADPILLTNVKQNINQTIGIKYEILGYDNSDGKRGICEIYNQGVREASYNILCFVHEDVEFSSRGWGESVIDAFRQNDRLGLLGLAGSSYKSLAPSGWQGTETPAEINFINLTQNYKYSQRASELRYSNTQSVTHTKVAVIDGVWFCARKDVLLKFPFDEAITKFHGYDIDISLSVGAVYDVCVTFEIKLTHFSEGNFGSDWIRTTLFLHEKWRFLLPVNKSSLSERAMEGVEKNAFKSFINTMRRSGYSSLSCLKVVTDSGIRERFGLRLYLRLVVKCLSA